VATDSVNRYARPMRIVLVSNTSWYLYNFRADTMRALMERGWEVVAVAPDDEYRAKLESLGASFRQWCFDRRSKSPWHAVGPFVRLLGVYREIRPDVVHHFTIKPVILGGIAARILRIPGIVQSVTGLGHAFAGSGPLERLALLSYKVALGGRALTIFQNSEDMERILASGVTRRARAILIRGSGVDVGLYDDAPRPFSKPTITFLMACRMLWPKGVREFVEASDIVAGACPECRFVLLGDADPGAPDTVPREWLAGASGRTHLTWPGFQDDVRPYVAEADAVVLPSYYNEGLPKSLLEGAAAGRPLIAADNRGSREIVRPGETGLLVRPGSPGELAAAMLRLVHDPETARRLGRRARELVADEFSRERVVRATS
jgi:glycosyltransferase involved in cell wall biosynthesis